MAMLGLDQVNWIGVIVSVFGAMAVGALWYGPLLGKVWLAEVNISEADIKQSGSAGALINAVVMNLLAASGIGVVAAMHQVTTVGGFVVTALLVCLLFNVTGQLTQDRFHMASAKLSVINAGNMVLAYLAMGLIQGLFA